jgi:dATP pyrophosphohydrolase
VTELRVSFVDAYVLRRVGQTLEVLVLRRARGRSPGSWETVHGTIEPGETPAEAALREVREETGLAPVRLYNLSRVETFYLHGADAVALVPVFAAFVDPTAPLVLSDEHDRAEWLVPAQAAPRFVWPRERRAIEDLVALLSSGVGDGGGDGGLLDEALRVC